jgi:hypothetical protein
VCYHLHLLIALKPGSLNLLEPYGPVQACNGIALPLKTQDRHFVLRRISVYLHPGRFATNCSEQTGALGISL